MMEKIVKKAQRVKSTRVEHNGKDWGLALIFTYRGQHDCLTDNNFQSWVDVIIPLQFTLIDGAVHRLNGLSEGTKKKKKNRD